MKKTLPVISMTPSRSRALYVSAGGERDHSESEWGDIHKEMIQVVQAKSDSAAANVIRWWGCWDAKYTATAFARRVREGYAKEEASK